jgi:hypothetical protein
MNKKADERVLSIYLFIIYIIVSIGIVSGVFIFYGTPLDVRKVEAGILNTRVIDCLAEQGKLTPEFFNNNFDLVTYCHFNFKDNTQKSMGEEEYAVNVEIFNFSDCNKTDCSNSGININYLEDCFSGGEQCLPSGKLKELKAGKTNYLEFCFSGGEKVPRCNQKLVYLLNNGEEVLMIVTSAVGKV